MCLQTITGMPAAVFACRCDSVCTGVKQGMSPRLLRQKLTGVCSEGWQRWLKGEGNYCWGGKTDGGCGLEVLAWTYCSRGSCHTVPLRLAEVEMKGMVISLTFIRVPISWMLRWNSDCVTRNGFPGCCLVAVLLWHVETPRGIECPMCFGFSAFLRSPLSPEHDAAVDNNCLEDRSVSAPRDFCVVRSLKHPREKKYWTETYQSIHQHSPPEPPLSSLPFSALWLFCST